MHARVLILNLKIITAERWRSMHACMHAATVVGASTHARSRCTSHVERPGGHPLYGDVPSHGVCVTKSVASSHPTTRQGTVISKASVIVGTRTCSRIVPKAVSSLTRQGPARMGDIWLVLAPLEALARACPANPGKTCIMARISG
jgi:hypothetical protein